MRALENLGPKTMNFYIKVKRLNFFEAIVAKLGKRYTILQFH